MANTPPEASVGWDRHHILSGVEDDRLALVPPVKEWTEEERARQIAVSQAARPSQRAAVVTAMRDDGVSILQWVAHYRVLGFDGIFIYSNDNRDVSPALLERLAAGRAITYIESRTSGSVSPQQRAYGHSLRALTALRDYEWVLYVDSDEFLTLAPRYGGDVRRLLDHVAEEFGSTPPAAVLFHWKGYVSDYAYEREEGLLLRRFQHSSDDRHFKSLVRLSEVGTMRPLHFPELLRPGFFVDSALRRVAGDGEAGPTWHYLAHGPPTYSGGQIRHFWAKSFQEFAVKKWRGDQLGMADNPYHREFRQFFEWNGLSTPERFEPPAEELLRRIGEDMQDLRSLPGVAALDRALQESFPDLLEPMGGDRALRSRYEEAYQEALGQQPKRRAAMTVLLIAAVALALLLLVIFRVAGGP